MNTQRISEERDENKINILTMYIYNNIINGAEFHSCRSIECLVLSVWTTIELMMNFSEGKVNLLFFLPAVL